MFRFILTVALLCVGLQALQTGEKLPPLVLQGSEGGKLDGSVFDSTALTSKVHVIFYVDPDEKDRNNPLSDALKAQDFDRERFASVAIINMDATWLPNFALESALKEKQEKFPHTLYVKDMKKKGISVWQVEDDNSDVIITDRDGKVLYLYEGEVPQSAFATIISLIKEHL